VNSNPDVVVVGSGLSGLATALAAVVRGLRVVVLEKGEKLGGASAYSGGQVWIPGNDAMLAAGIADTIEEGATYVRALSHERPDLLDEDAMIRWLNTGYNSGMALSRALTFGYIVAEHLVAQAARVEASVAR
jgi:3-oxosteroid 1-dehydrogenase